jgi:hypothetical protein
MQCPLILLYESKRKESRLEFNNLKDSSLSGCTLLHAAGQFGLRAARGVVISMVSLWAAGMMIAEGIGIVALREGVDAPLPSVMPRLGAVMYRFKIQSIPR